MALTLRELTARAALDLRVVHPGPPGAMNVPISWVHSTELADPGPFLEGGELLLTLGMRMPGDPAEGEAPAADGGSVRNFVSRVARSGACGIGFGTGLQHAVVPSALVAAAQEFGVPLLEVPRNTPFIAVSKAISRAFMDAELDRLRRSYHTQRQLIAAASGQDATRTIVRRTAELLGGWAALVDGAGVVVEASHPSAGPLVRASSRGRSARPGEVVFETQGATDITSYPLMSPGGHPLGHLVAGRRGVAGSVDHALVSVATTLLSLSTYRTMHAERAMNHMRSVLMRRLLEQQVQQITVFADDVWGGLPRTPLLLVCLHGSVAALRRVSDTWEPWRHQPTAARDAVVFGEVDGVLWAAVSAERADAVLGRLGDLPGLTGGVSGAAWWDQARRARREAEQACQAAADRGGGLVRHGQAADVSLASLLDAGRLRTFAELRLAPLLDASAGDDDLVMLLCWLRHHAQHDPAARELGIHRHTLRKRLHRLEELLGVDLADPTTRAELWIAGTTLRPDTTRG